jgi:hypothetical protein
LYNILIEFGVPMKLVRLIKMLNLIVCIMLHVLDQVEGFCLMQHCFNSCLLFYSNFRMKMVIQPKHVAVTLNKIVNNYSNSVVLDGNPST